MAGLFFGLARKARAVLRKAVQPSSLDHQLLARYIALELYQLNRYDIDCKVPKVLVNPDDTLVFDLRNPKLDLELSRLRRILNNSSAHSEYIVKYLNQGEGRKPTALRLAFTMQHSLAQVARLLNGEDLDEIPDLKMERD